MRIENRGRLRHEVDAAEDDDIGVSSGGFLAQLQRIADEVGDVLHLAALVVMGEDDGVLLLFKLQDLLFEGLCHIFILPYSGLYSQSILSAPL